MYAPNVPTVDSVMLPVSLTVVPTNENDRPLGIFVNVRRGSPFSHVHICPMLDMNVKQWHMLTSRYNVHFH